MANSPSRSSSARSASRLWSSPAFGKPQVVTKEIDGKLHEPTERLTIDAPEEHLGAITQLLALRKGRMEQMTNHGTGWVRMNFLVPSRAADLWDSAHLEVPHPDTRLHRHRAPTSPRHMSREAGDIQSRSTARSWPTDAGAATAYAMTNLQEGEAIFAD